MTRKSKFNAMIASQTGHSATRQSGGVVPESKFSRRRNGKVSVKRYMGGTRK